MPSTMLFEDEGCESRSTRHILSVIARNSGQHHLLETAHGDERLTTFAGIEAGT